MVFAHISRYKGALAASVLLSAAFSLVTIPAAHAQSTAFSSFGPNDSYLYGDGILVEDIADNRVGLTPGMQFTAANTVAGVNTLDMASFIYTPGTMTVQIFADSGSGTPTGSALLSFSRNDIGTSDIYRFSSAQSATLSAGTSYWLVASGTNGFQGGIWWNDQGYTTNRYDTILYRPIDGGGSNSGSYQGGPQGAFALSAQSANAAAAPEPGSIALLLTAGVPVAGLVRRRKDIGKKP